jgi:outer membrane biosynthesis protein TonB
LGFYDDEYNYGGSHFKDGRLLKDSPVVQTPPEPKPEEKKEESKEEKKEEKKDEKAEGTKKEAAAEEKEGTKAIAELASQMSEDQDDGDYPDDDANMQLKAQEGAAIKQSIWGSVADTLSN